MSLGTLSFLALLGALSANASLDLGVAHGNDEDLTHFVTRPEIKVPRFDVTIYDPGKLVPGYWFVGPYAKIQQQPIAPGYYQPCQTGPTIYDQNGVSSPRA